SAVERKSKCWRHKQPPHQKGRKHASESTEPKPPQQRSNHDGGIIRGERNSIVYVGPESPSNKSCDQDRSNSGAINHNRVSLEVMKTAGPTVYLLGVK